MANDFEQENLLPQIALTKRLIAVLDLVGIETAAHQEGFLTEFGDLHRIIGDPHRKPDIRVMEQARAVFAKYGVVSEDEQNKAMWLIKDIAAAAGLEIDDLKKIQDMPQPDVVPYVNAAWIGVGMAAAGMVGLYLVWKYAIRP